MLAKWQTCRHRQKYDGGHLLEEELSLCYVWEFLVKWVTRRRLCQLDDVIMFGRCCRERLAGRTTWRWVIVTRLSFSLVGPRTLASPPESTVGTLDVYYWRLGVEFVFCVLLYQGVHCDWKTLFMVAPASQVAFASLSPTVM